MKIHLTEDFKNNTLLAEKGIKCVLRGFALVRDTKSWLKKLYENTYEFESITLEELQEHTTLVTDEDKNSEDLLNNLFDITYEPCLEIQTPDDVACTMCNGTGIYQNHMCYACDGKGRVPYTNEKGTVLGGEKFGTYKIRLNAMRNNKTEAGLKGTYRAIAIIGEKYTEDTVHVITKNKSYIGILIYFDGQDAGQTIAGGVTEDLDGLHINADTAFTINFQFSLSQMHLVDTDNKIEIDPEYAEIMNISQQKDQTTTQLALPGVFLVPSGKEYSNRVDLEVGKTYKNAGIAYIDKTLNLIPDTYKNNNIFNVTPRVNIFDEHNDKFVKPQVMLSHGGLVEGDFVNQSIAIEYDKKWFAMNEKAPTGASRFDLFGGATKLENRGYDDSRMIATSGYFRLVSDRGYHLGGENMVEVLSNANTAGIYDGALYVSDNNCIGEAAKAESSTSGDTIFKTSDFHAIDTQGITATAITGGMVIDSNESKFGNLSGLTAIGTYKANAYNDKTAEFNTANYKPSEGSDPYFCYACDGKGEINELVDLASVAHQSDNIHIYQVNTEAEAKLYAEAAKPEFFKPDMTSFFVVNGDSPVVYTKIHAFNHKDYVVRITEEISNKDTSIFTAETKWHTQLKKTAGSNKLTISITASDQQTFVKITVGRILLSLNSTAAEVDKLNLEFTMSNEQSETKCTCAVCNGDGRIGEYSYPGRIMMYGLNTSSFDFNGYNNTFIGHKGLMSNFGHDAIIFGKHNACGNREYDLCLYCNGEGRVFCDTCDGTGEVTGYPLTGCDECQGYCFVNYSADKCTYCDGHGRMPNNTICPMCNGHTYPDIPGLSADGQTYSAFISGDEACYTCPVCNGKGEVVGELSGIVPCEACEGIGRAKCKPCLGKGFTEGYIHPLAHSACPTCTDLMVECPWCGGVHGGKTYKDESGDTYSFTSGYKVNIECTTCSGKGIVNGETCFTCEGEGRVRQGPCPRCNGDLQVCDKCNGFGQDTCTVCSGYTTINCPECNDADICTCDLCKGEGKLYSLADVKNYVGGFNWLTYKEWAISGVGGDGKCQQCNGTGLKKKWTVQALYPNYSKGQKVYVINGQFYDINDRYFPKWRVVNGKMQNVDIEEPYEYKYIGDDGKEQTALLKRTVTKKMYVSKVVDEVQNRRPEDLAYTDIYGLDTPKFVFTSQAKAQAWLDENRGLLYSDPQQNSTEWQVLESTSEFDWASLITAQGFETIDSKTIVHNMFTFNTGNESNDPHRPYFVTFDTKAEAEEALNEIKTFYKSHNVYNNHLFRLAEVTLNENGKCEYCAGLKKKNVSVSYKCPKCSNLSDWENETNKFMFNWTGEINQNFHYQFAIYDTPEKKSCHYAEGSLIWVPENLRAFKNHYCGEVGKIFRNVQHKGYHECELCDGLGIVSQETRIAYLGNDFETRLQKQLFGDHKKVYDNSYYGFTDKSRRYFTLFGEDRNFRYDRTEWATTGLSSLCPRCSNFYEFVDENIWNTDFDTYLNAVVPICTSADVYNYDTYKRKNVHDRIWSKLGGNDLEPDHASKDAIFHRGVDSFCNACNFNGAAVYRIGNQARSSYKRCLSCGCTNRWIENALGETIEFQDKCLNCGGTYFTSATTPEPASSVQLDGRGIIKCDQCNGTAAEPCDKCNQVKHWYCTTCSGDGEVEFQPTIAYEDGKVVAVGDGYFYKNLMVEPENFDMYRDYINIHPEDNCNLNVGQYIKKMNLFSVEKNGLLMVHNNNYDQIPDPHVKHELAADFFAVRQWAKYNDLQERFANLQNGCYAPDAIYFTKRTAHNEEWKLRIRELDYLLNDSYIKTNASMLKTAALNQAIYDFYRKNTTFLLRLGPILTYGWKGKKGSKGASTVKTSSKGTKGAKGAKGLKGMKGRKGLKGTTLGIKGAKGMKGLKGLKGTKDYQEMVLVVTNRRYKYYIEDILKIVRSEFGKYVSNTGNLGKNPETYTFYCINGDPKENLYFKGVRLRKMTNGNYQTLNSVKGVKPGYVQRIVYKDNGYNGEYGVMNFNYAYNNKFLA